MVVVLYDDLVEQRKRKTLFRCARSRQKIASALVNQILVM